MYAPYFPLPGQDLGPKRLSPPPQEFAGILRWMGDRLPRAEFTSEAKLFLRRRADQHRRMTNDTSIERLAIGLGFSVLDPEQFGFAEQCRLVDGASAIAGPDGSALALALFARSGRKITILNHHYLEAVSALATVLEELGHDILLVRGRCVRQDEHYVRFSDYEISEDEFRAAVSR
jgi:capsular polysaccharide biosynthesis protein